MTVPVLDRCPLCDRPDPPADRAARAVAAACAVVTVLVVSAAVVTGAVLGLIALARWVL